MENHDLESEAARKNYSKPYGAKHPVPTIQGYREHRKELDERAKQTEQAQHEPQDDSRAHRAYTSAKTILKGQDDTKPSSHDPYPVSNHNDQLRPRQEASQTDSRSPEKTDSKSQQPKDGKEGKSATEQAASAIDPKQKRKAMKNAKKAGGREVTDPVTHLPITIYDQTDKDLNSVPENQPPPGADHWSATGLDGATKSHEELDEERTHIQRGYHGLQKTFPPPSFKQVEQDLAAIYKKALTAGLAAVLSIATFAVTAPALLQSRESSTASRLTWATLCGSIALGLGIGAIFGVRGWLDKKISSTWQDRTWDALQENEEEELTAESELPESVQWLNSLLTSIWPLINPDLFTSLVDTLEDVMQASLPKVVRMVSVDDMGQGTEALRVLGIRLLPTGAASQSVDDEGNLQSPEKSTESDRTTPGQGQQDQAAGDGESDDDDHSQDGQKTAEQKKQDQAEQQAIRAGMEAEEGDFVNMELAFAYRTRSTGKSIRSKAKNAHLYLKFYLPGGIAVPVWVEVRGLMGIMRLRLQLTPDPPFFSICTFTFLGQPKADLSCVPLSKHSLNVMDVPLISSFVQSAIDAALAEYVAPKSMTLDLKDMLMGEDFKKDTAAKGVVWIFIKKARDFKQGDGGIGPFEGASDSYVSVSWGKFGKPVASTRIIVDDQKPNWHEWASILVTADELNANERLKLQLWDSDKWTADDDLGRVEVDLKELMSNPDTKNKMCDREDRFKGSDTDEDMPGTLSWSVGFFEKTRITDMQLQKQTYDKNIRSKQDLEKHVGELAERKLREAKADGKHDDELHQQKVQDYKEVEDNMIISAPPSPDHLSGVLSVQIHNVTGLEISQTNKSPYDDQDPEDEGEEGGNLPDSYCTIIINHRKVYRTRTKPKNAKPFFNAGTERFIKDWKTTELIVSVRDSREREDDALLGVVYLPLAKVFAKRSQIMDIYPLVGGIGYGRARISMVWRSVELKLPAELRGWDYGTIELKGAIRPKGQLQENLQHDRIKIRTNLSKTKMHPNNGQWESKRKGKDDSTFLAVRRRYASALVIVFRKSALGPDKTQAFAILWLNELVDDEEQTKTLQVWEGGKKALAKAEACCDYSGSDDNDKQSPIGELELTLKFWRGLSGYHKSHAERSQNADVRNVMECLDTINDENLEDLYSDATDSSASDSDSDHTETENESSSTSPQTKKTKSDPLKADTAKSQNDNDIETRKKLRTHTNQSDSDSDNSDLESSESSGFAKVKAPLDMIQQGISAATDKVTGDNNIQDDGSRGLRAQVQDYKQNHKQLHRKHRGIMQWRGVRTLDWAGGKVKRAKGRVEDAFVHSEKDQGIETEV